MVRHGVAEARHLESQFWVYTIRHVEVSGNPQANGEGVKGQFVKGQGCQGWCRLKFSDESTAVLDLASCLLAQRCVDASENQLQRKLNTPRSAGIEKGTQKAAAGFISELFRKSKVATRRQQMVSRRSG